MKTLLYWITRPWTKWQERKKRAQRLAELRKRDPFIYK